MIGTVKNPIDASVASEKNNGRVPMGTSATGWSDKTAIASAATHLEPSKNGKADPLGITSGNPVRGRGRCGAQHKITAMMPAQTGEAAATQANGRILPPTSGVSGNFYAQTFDGRM